MAVMIHVASDPRHEAIERIARSFVFGEPGRSVAVRSLRGGSIDVGVAADVVRPAASLLKIPIVAAVHARAGAGELDLESSVTRDELGTTAFGTVLSAFGPEHRFTLRELCGLALVASDNLAAEHLLGLVGAGEVNRVAAALAGPATRLEVGFSDPYLGTDGLVNVTTAREALRMVATVVSDPVHAELARGLRNTIRNPRLPLRLPQLRVTSKSGTLYGVVNDVGVLYGAENDLAVAFLCEGQQDREATGLELGDCAAELWAALGDANGFVRRA